MGDKLKWVVMTETINKLDRFRFINPNPTIIKQVEAL